MPRFVYTEDHIEFLSKSFKARSIDDTTSMFNEKFGLSKTRSQIRSTLSNHGLRCGRTTGEIRRGSTRLFNRREVEFIATKRPIMSCLKLSMALNAKFNRNITDAQIHSFCNNHKIKSGKTGWFEKGVAPWNSGTKGVMKANKTSFKKGHTPEAYRPVGSERITPEGYTEIKTADPAKWRHKQRVIWEQHNGDIPEGYKIRFRDGDRANFDINNLFLVSNSENISLTLMDHAAADESLKPTIELIAKITSKSIEKAKRRAI